MNIQKFAVMVLILSGLFLNIACQKNDSGSSSPAPAATPYYGNYGMYNNGYATTPQPCNYNNNGGYYPNQGMCNQYYNQFQTYYPNFNSNYSNMNWYYGAWYWPTQNINYQTGYCGCPSGYTPVYSNYFGVSCAPNTTFTSWNVTWINIGAYWGQPQNSWPLNNPQVQYSGNTPGCNQVAQGCDVRMNNCSAGYTCRPVAGGSTIGLCAL